jgi:hypothetical protein
MPAYELRPMGVGDIFDTTFRLYRTRFLTFVTIALCVYIPYSLIAAGLEGAKTGIYGSYEAEADETEEATDLLDDENRGPDVSEYATRGYSGMLYYFLSMAGYLFFVVLVFPLCIGAIIQNISAAYLGEEQSAVESYRRAGRRILKLIAVQIAVTLITSIGYIFCIVPGVFFTLWYMLATVVAMVEDTTIGKTLPRSRELIQDNLRKGIGLGLVVAILSYLLTMVFVLFNTLIPWPHPALAEFTYTLLTALVLPIQTAPLVLLYYDLRIRKEGFDLERLAMAMRGGPAPEA